MAKKQKAKKKSEWFERDSKSFSKLKPVKTTPIEEKKVENKFEKARREQAEYMAIARGETKLSLSEKIEARLALESDKPQRELNTDNCATGCKTNKTPEIKRANPLQTIGRNVEINPKNMKEVKHNG